MKRVLGSLVTLTFLLVTSAVLADAESGTPGTVHEATPHHGVLTPAQRQALWERLQTRLAVLREKKANGTLNLRQEQALERLEKREALILKRRQERAKQRWAPPTTPQ